jgi:hypothetical protein
MILRRRLGVSAVKNILSAWGIDLIKLSIPFPEKYQQSILFML